MKTERNAERDRPQLLFFFEAFFLPAPFFAEPFLAPFLAEPEPFLAEPEDFFGGLSLASLGSESLFGAAFFEPFFLPPAPLAFFERLFSGASSLPSAPPDDASFSDFFLSRRSTARIISPSSSK
eukprot:Amastigsp_a191590_13.p3 type:complete len:124 gc:universal Amastigsp_a191590_13:412-783(+)